MDINKCNACGQDHTGLNLRNELHHDKITFYVYCPVSLIKVPVKQEDKLKEVARMAYFNAAALFGTSSGYGTVESPIHRPKEAQISEAFEKWWGTNFDPYYQPAPYPEPLGEKEGLFVLYWETMNYTGGWGCYNSHPRSYQDCVEFHNQVRGHLTRPLVIVRYYA